MNNIINNNNIFKNDNKNITNNINSIKIRFNSKNYFCNKTKCSSIITCEIVNPNFTQQGQICSNSGF